MLIYSPHHKLNIFIEYINVLIQDENDIYKTWKFGEKIEITDEHKIIIFLQVVPNHGNDIIFKNTQKVNIFVCNTEQLTSNCNAFVFNIEPLYEHTKINQDIYFGVTDYSEQNLKIINQNKFIIDNNIETFYLPYQYQQKEIDFLKSEFTKEKKVFTCGCQSERRIKIRENLLDEHGIKIDVSHGFYDPRDKFMMKYKIMLNISTKDEFTIYEHIRCDRLIFAGLVIISEHKIDEEKLDIYDLVIWCTKEEFADKVEEVLQNYEFYQNKISDEKIKYIALSREKIYAEFRNKFI